MGEKFVKEQEEKYGWLYIEEMEGESYVAIRFNISINIF